MSKLRLLISALCVFSVCDFPAIAIEPEKKPDVLAILPMTGPASYLGEELRNGMLLALEQHGNSIDISFEDSQSSGQGAVSVLTQKLLARKPEVILSSMSSVSMSLAPVAERLKIPLIGLVVTTPKFAGQNPWTFKFFPSASEEVDSLVPAIRRMDVRRLGVLYVVDDFGSSILEQFRKRESEMGTEIIAEQFLPADSDFRTQLLRLKGRAIDGLYIVGFDSHLRTAFRQAYELGLHVKLFAPSTMSIPGLRADLGEAVKGAVIAAPFLYNRTSRESEAFLRRYRERFGIEASYYAANAYDCISLLKQLSGERTTAHSIQQGLLNLKEFKGILGVSVMRAGGHELAFPMSASIVRRDSLDLL